MASTLLPTADHHYTGYSCVGSGRDEVSVCPGCGTEHFGAVGIQQMLELLWAALSYISGLAHRDL